MPSEQSSKSDILKNGAGEAKKNRKKVDSETNGRIYSFRHVEAAKDEMFRQINQLSAEGKIPAGFEDLLRNILLQYHDKVAQQFFALETQVKLEHELCESTRQQLELERQNEDLLMEAVSNLQEQMVLPTGTHNTDAVGMFVAPSTTTSPTTTPKSTPEKS